MAQNVVNEKYGEEIIDCLNCKVRLMIGFEVATEARLEKLDAEFESYIERDELLCKLLELYSSKNYEERRPVIKAVCKMFIMEKLFGKD